MKINELSKSMQNVWVEYIEAFRKSNKIELVSFVELFDNFDVRAKYTATLKNGPVECFVPSSKKQKDDYGNIQTMIKFETIDDMHRMCICSINSKNETIIPHSVAVKEVNGVKKVILRDKYEGKNYKFEINKKGHVCKFKNINCEIANNQFVK